MSAITVDVITDPARFAGLETAWNETVDRAGLTHPFLRHEWLSSWWDAFARNRELNVMVIRDGSRILGLAPMMLERARICGVPVRRVQFLHNDHTPKADVIVADRVDDVYAAFWKTLLDARRHWDVVQLSQLPGDSVTHQYVGNFAARESYATTLWSSDASPYVELSENWTAYLGRLAPKLRQNLRNRLSRLTKLGEPSLEMIAEPGAIRDAREDALRLEASGWKREAGTAITSDPEVSQFYRLLAERAGAQGWLRLLFLTVNGKRIATSYSSSYQNRLSFFKTGYDPEFAQYAPFKLLTYLAIRDGFDRGLGEVDFLGDAEPWKLEWTKTIRPHDWLFVFGNTARGKLAHTVKCRVMPAIKRWRKN